MIWVMISFLYVSQNSIFVLYRSETLWRSKGFTVNVSDIVINAGAEMLVAIAGKIMRMPGLPKEPQALHIDIVNGEIEGLS